MNVNKLPVSYGFKWYTMAWNATKSQWTSFFGVAAISFVIQMVASLVPVVGSLVSGAVNSLLVTGLFLLAHRWQTQKEFKFSNLFLAFSDKKIFMTILPFVIFSTVWSGVIGVVESETNANEASAGIEGTLYALIMLFLSLASFAFTFFSPPLMVLGGQTFGASIKLTWRAFHKNILVFITTLVPILLVVAIAFGPMIVLVLISSLGVDMTDILDVAGFVPPVILFTIFVVCAPLFMFKPYVYYSTIFTNEEFEVIKKDSAPQPYQH